MWNSKRSLHLSRFCVVFFFCLLVATAVAAPWLVAQYLQYSHLFLWGAPYYFLITIYLGCLPAAILLFSLYRLLKRIGADQVFLPENVECLRRISWSCFAGAVLCCVSALYYLPWIIVAVAAAFMSLIVRVIKNVFAQAVELKNEVDYTI